MFIVIISLIIDLYDRLFRRLQLLIRLICRYFSGCVTSDNTDVVGLPVSLAARVLVKKRDV